VTLPPWVRPEDFQPGVLLKKIGALLQEDGRLSSFLRIVILILSGALYILAALLRLYV
jgi:hypothetical protein